MGQVRGFLSALDKQERRARRLAMIVGRACQLDRRAYEQAWRELNRA